MEQQNKLVTWHDAKMIGGDKWREDIFKHLADSDILLYLVSAASLESKNCNKELAEAIRSEIRVIPIILESCDWLNHQLSDFQALPDKGLPVNKWQPESDGWQNVVDGIRKAVEEMQTEFQKGTLPEWVFQQGNFLMMLGHIDKAIEAYSHAIKLNPSHANAHNNRGVAYYINDDFDRAIIDCNTAIRLNPNFAAAYYNRGGAYHNRGKYDLAIVDFTKAIQLKPDYADAYNNRGISYQEKGKHDLAIVDFTKATQLKPDYASVYSNRGASYQEKGKHDLAIVDCNTAIRLNPNYPNAYNNRGVAYNNKNEHDLAIADYTKAIELNPNNAEAYSNRGFAYSGKGEHDLAIVNCTKAIELNANYANAYNNRGIAYSNKGDFDLAIADYTKAIKLNPKHANAHSNRGLAYGLKSHFDLAIVDCNKAMELNPNCANAYSNRGIVYSIKGDFDLAIADYTKAIELNQDSATAYNNRGLAYGVKSDFDLAIADYTKAIELNPNLAEIYCNRGEAWLHVGEWKSAKSDLTIAEDMGVDIIASFHNTHENVEAYERANRVKLPEDIAAMLTQRRRSRFPRTQKFSSSDGTPFESPDVLNLLTKLRNAGTPLSEYIQTRPTFGLKTGRQEAFVVDGGTRDQLIAEHASSVDILKPFLHGRDIRRWQVARPNSWLIFTYRGIEINRYPAIQRHLEKYTASLNERAGKQKWYELPTAKRDAGRFTQTKLICPNLYNHQTFAIDTEGFYCGDTCFLIPTEETWLCGLLNSRVVEWFYSQVSDQLTGDYLRARSGYMQQIPIPDLTSAQKSLIGKIVNYLIFLQGQPTTSSGDLAHARDFIMLKYFERIVDGLVYESYLREDLHHGDKQFFKPLLDERLPQLEEMGGDKMSALQEIFERLYERTHPIRRNLFFLDSVKPIRVIEGKA